MFKNILWYSGNSIKRKLSLKIILINGHNQVHLHIYINNLVYIVYHFQQQQKKKIKHCFSIFLVHNKLEISNLHCMFSNKQILTLSKYFVID